MLECRPAQFSLALLASLSIPSLASAAEYYAAPSGSGDGSEGSPFSLSQAANTAQAGDTVYLRGGTYSGTLNPANSGTSSAWITFQAYPGEVPIFDGGGSGGSGVGSGSREYLRFVGIVSRNFSSGGFGNGWTNGDCNPNSNGYLQFINVIADGNGINGIAFYCATGILIEQSIISHNGNMLPSWSSGVNLFGVTGSTSSNVVRQSISFENVDISSNHTDGSGFILDQNSSGGTFENNIGFRNGGSCIRLTNSPNSLLVNNTCFNNGLDTSALYRDEIFYSDSSSRNGATLRNNVAVASSGNDALWGATGVTQQNNHFVDSGGAAPFWVSTTGVYDFNLSSDASELVDAGTSSGAPSNDIGFDPNCIKQQSGQAISWWQYAVDMDYIQSIGGVGACFNPRARSGAPDIGAYESGGSTSGSTSTNGSGGTGTGGTTTDVGGTTGSVDGRGGSGALGGAGGTGDTAATSTGGGATTTGDGATSTTGTASGGVGTTGAIDSSVGTTGAAGTSGTLACPDAAYTLCGDTCYDLAASSAHCGACGNACASDQYCAEGLCVGRCSAPLSLCSESCVDIASDAANCGACGAACAAGQVCSQGSCSSACAQGTTQCAQACVDVASDILHCGSCASPCQSGQTCQGGVCTGTPTGGDPTMPTTVEDAEPVPASVGPAQVAEDGGCSCRLAGNPRGRIAVGFALLAAIGAGWRRWRHLTAS